MPPQLEDLVDAWLAAATVRPAHLRLLAANAWLKQRRQARFTQRVRATHPAATTWSPDVTYWKDARDPTHLSAVFIEHRDDVVLHHLAWTDEVIPVNVLDQAYREIRREVFGRSFDVETVAYTPDTVAFEHDWAGPQPYYTSIHLSARLNQPQDVYTRTWNHMMHTQPNPLASYERTSPVFLEGRREDANPI